jgi:hypothetical protein
VLSPAASSDNDLGLLQRKEQFLLQLISEFAQTLAVAADLTSFIPCANATSASRSIDNLPVVNCFRLIPPPILASDYASHKI